MIVVQDMEPVHWHQCASLPGMPPGFNQACADLTFSSCEVVRWLCLTRDKGRDCVFVFVCV